METYTATLNDKQIAHLQTSLKKYIVQKSIPYALFQLKMSDCTITAYTSKKVVFQGEGAAIYASPYLKIETKTSSSQQVVFPHGGSDEVGTGDYFGPVCVCATIVEEKNLPMCQELHIQDSKQINDAMILKIAPTLMKNLNYSLLVLDNFKYNEIHETTNMNAIKAKLHNQAYLHLQAKVKQLPKLCVVDQFTPKQSYYRYLAGEEKIVDTLTFETKAENKYLAVACGSIIARFAFLKAMDALSEHYDFELPKGAGPLVDVKIQEFYDRFGMKGLYNAAKVHFKNTEKLRKN